MEQVQRICYMATILAVFLAATTSLTTDEVNQFYTSGQVETNTGKVGTVNVAESGNNYVLTSNGIPDHATGTFPAQFNPNSITEQAFSFQFPKNPTVAAEVSCLPMGPIAFAKNGIPIFNPFTAEGLNAVEGEDAEVFDQCNGHPDQMGVYHYHQNPPCLNTRATTFIGVALDGFPIYGTQDENGRTLTSSDLDECNGRTVNGAYRYHITTTFPYVMGCYKGTRTTGTGPGECRYALNTAPGIAAYKAMLLIPVVLSLCRNIDKNLTYKTYCS